MRKVQSASSWVVYQSNGHGKTLGGSAVCGAEEWAALEQAQPGQLTLVRAGIGSEREAELLARGTSGDSFGSRAARKA